MAFADGGMKSTRLPFPSFIYGILESQGFVSHIDEHLTGEAEVFKLAPALLKGQRKLDLPWNPNGVGPSVTNTEDNTAAASASDQAMPLPTSHGPTSSITVSTYFLHSQLAFALNQISYYEEHVTILRRMLQGPPFSDQQRGV